MGQISKDLLKFLDQADDVYIEAYQTRRFLILKDMFTREAMEGINLKVLQEGESRYFAAKHYRLNSWELLDEFDNTITLRKTCNFKRIHIGLFKTMPASTDYEEEWTVERGGKFGYLVSSIGREVYI